jgi:amino acid transporter
MLPAPMSPSPAEPRRTLTFLPLVAATYFMVAGGPYGLEELVGKAGYSRTFLILLVTPIVWSIPTALMEAELSAAIPEEGGYYVWVRRALGPFWGFFDAWLAMMASIFDMAICATIFVLYFGRIWPDAVGGWRSVAVGSIVIAASAAWNIRGARAVGNGSVWLSIPLLGPFVVMIAIAAIHGSVAASSLPSAPQTDIVGGLLIAMWNYMGWNAASTIAGEVSDPQKTYPRVLGAATVMVIATYVLVVGACAWAGVNPTGWTTGSWTEAGRQIGGPWLGYAVIAGGLTCGLGMINALMMSYSRLPMVLAEDRYLPAPLALRNPRTGAPVISIVACSVAWAGSLLLGFDRLVELDVLIYGCALLLSFIALVRLRVKEPDLPRPFRVPGGILGVSVLGVGPMLLVGLGFFRGEFGEAATQDRWVSALLLMLFVLGPLVYAFSRRQRSDHPARRAG